MTRYKAILLPCPSINTETSRAVLAHVLVESHGVVSPRGDHRPRRLPGVGVVLQDGVPSSPSLPSSEYEHFVVHSGCSQSISMRWELGCSSPASEVHHHLSGVQLTIITSNPPCHQKNILTVFIDVSSAGVVRSTHAEMWKELHGPIKRVSCHGTCWSPCVDVSRISI